MHPINRLPLNAAFFILLVMLLPACMIQNPETPSSVAETTATSNPSVYSPTHPPQPISTEFNQTPDPPGTPTPTPNIPEELGERTRYQLTAILNYDQHYLLVDETIIYTNRLSLEIPDLRLMVDPLYYPGVFTLQNISWGDGQPVSDYKIETGQINIPLPNPLAPGESIELSLTFDLHLPSPTPSADVRPVPFGYTARQSNFVDWYPFVPPYVPGVGWQAHQAGFFGEHLVYELADFEVSIRLSDEQPDPAISEIQIAASAPARIENEWHHYQHQAARNFAWSASREYQIFTTTVGDTTIMSYAFPFHAAAGEAVLQTTAESLALFNEMYKVYPHTLLSVVEADFLDGMEYDGMYFLSNGFYNLYQGQPDEYLIAIAAHETAHQWFYALVGNDQAIEPWLDEALCTYQEHIYYEKLYPEAIDWWWAYRVNYYNPQGWVDGSIYNPQGYRSYRDAVYLNGAMFLDELRTQIGDDTFFSFLKDYVAKTSSTISSTDQFFDILSLHTDLDLTPLITEYFHFR